MKLAFSTLGCPNWSLDEILSTAKDLGYSAVEIRGLLGELDATKMKELTVARDKTQAALERLGLKISMLTSAAKLAIYSEKEQSVAEAKAYIDLAAELKVHYVRVMSTGQPYFDGGDILLCEKLYAEIVRYSEGTGVTPLLETNGLFVDTAKLASLLNSVGGNCGALWDVHHPFRFGDETVEQTVQNLGSHIKYVHLKDSVMARGTVQYKMAGYGDVPLTQAVRLLQSNGYDGFYTLEWVKRWNKDLEDGGIVFAQFPHFMGEIA